MSTDHIFAAQMWTWPEPMIKRDSHGRILVVNAAFLQLYGGSVESWTGSPIAGWPDPQGPGHVARFESRIPLQAGGETVYDWVECTLTDGTSLTLARDVSAFVQTPASVTPTNIANPVPQQSIAPTVAPTAQADNPPAAPAQILSEIIHQPAQAAPKDPVVQATPIAEPAPVPAPTEMIAEPIASAPFTPAPSEKPPIVAPLPLENTELAQAAPEPVSQETRDFERRALPIENQDAILGNNWRDAVIAKAAGLDASPQDNDESSEKKPSPQSQASSTSGIRVLLAEDNAINALLTRTLLEAEGCHCDVVEDGALAVEAVKNNQYDMIFMDMRMPNMDGLEATRKIRSMGHGAKILPIVALTANAFDDDRNACFDSGMNDFMTKPVSAEELSDMVKSHTGLEAQAIAS